MKKLFLPILLLFSALYSSAQKNYFIYIQSENGQAFYVKMGERTYSSTASGYLILSRLHDSTYMIKLGFPQDRSPEQQYAVSILRRDHGYLLKHFGEKGWGLFDLQSLAVQMSATASSKTSSSGKSSVRSVSHFAEVLSRASDDPSLKEAVVRVRVPEKTKEPVTEVVAKKEPARTATDEPKEVAVKKTETAKPVEDPDKEAVSKKEETKPVADNPRDMAGQKDVNPTEATKTNSVKETVTKKEEAKPLVEKNTTARSPEVLKKEEPVTKTDAPKEGPVLESVVNKNNSAPVIETKHTTATEKTEKEPISTQVVEKRPVLSETEPAKKDLAKEIKEPAVEKSAAGKETYQKSQVTKKSERSTTQGFGIVFIDAQPDGARDTIDIEIPNPVSALTSNKVEPKTDKKFLEIGAGEVVTKAEAKKEEKGEEIKESKPVTEPATVAAVKNDCRSTAGKNDFFRLRRDMAGAKSDEGMLNLAKRQFKQRCYTVDQLKNLGALFLTDEARYQFFDIAYKHTSDPEHYAILQEELKEAYYINRFKAMLRN